MIPNAGNAIIPAQKTTSPDALAVALGYQNWNYHPGAATNTGTLASQTIYATAIWLPFGKIVTGLTAYVVQAGVGTAPTGFYVGLASPTNLLAQSGNLNASTALTTLGAQQFALNATYTTAPVDSPTGLFYVVYLENGAFGTTSVQFGRQSGIGSGGVALSGQKPNWATAGTGQTVLPVNGTAVTLTAGSTAWHVGAY